MVLTKTPLKKQHRTSANTNLKDDGTISNNINKLSLVKKTTITRTNNAVERATINLKKDPKTKPTNMKSSGGGGGGSSKILKSASVTKKTGEISKIPVPLSKSSTYKQVTVQKHKLKTSQKKKTVEEPQKADVKFVMSPKDKSSPHLDKYSQSDVASRVKQMKKHDAENLKRIKNQYFSSVLADIRKTDLETTLRKYASTDKNVPSPEIKKKKRKSLKKKASPPKTIRLSPRIVSENNENENNSINSIRKDTPSMTTHYLEADSQTSQIPVTKRHYKLVKTKKSPRAKLADGGHKDAAKATQITQHKKKSKTHTLKLNRVQSSDSVPNLPIREIKHNDSFVLSAKKLENSSSMKRAQRHMSKKSSSPEHLKLKTKRPKSAHHHQQQATAAFKSSEPKSDSTKPEQLKSCLKKTWDENDFTAVNTKYEMNFGLVPLIVN